MAYFALIAPAQQWFDANGNPRSGYKLFTYEAGTSSKKTTYTDDTGGVAHANPIVLDSSGMCASGVFGSSGAYKLVLAPPTDTDPPLSPVWTRDGVAGINDVAASDPDEWVASSLTPTYISASSFSVPGDQTAVFQVGRRLKCTLAGSTRYGYISASAFSVGVTTVTFQTDAGALDATLSAVAYGLLSVTNSSLPMFPVARVLFRQAATVQVISTVAETDLFNFTIPGGILGTDRALCVEAYGDFFNNTGGAANITLRGVFGGTNLFTTGAVSWAAAGNARGWWARIILGANNSTSAQASASTLITGPSAVTSAAGVMSPTVADFTTSATQTLGENSTNPLALALKVTLGASSVNLYYRVRNVTVTLL